MFDWIFFKVENVLFPAPNKRTTIFFDLNQLNKKKVFVFSFSGYQTRSLFCFVPVLMHRCILASLHARLHHQSTTFVRRYRFVSFSMFLKNPLLKNSIFVLHYCPHLLNCTFSKIRQLVVALLTPCETSKPLNSKTAPPSCYVSTVISLHKHA